MGISRQQLSRRSFVRAAGAALALGALASLPPRASLAGWHVSGAWSGLGGEGATYAPAPFPTVEFGTYPQGADGEVEPIEWYVLAEEGGRQLLLSKHVLDAQPYNEEYADVTWETCTLRAWLNADFLEAAFSAEEQARIAEVELANPDNPDFGTPGGNPTRDRVFYLSIDEAIRRFGVGRTWDQLYYELGDEYYDADGNINYGRIYAEEPGYEALVARPTGYAVSRGVWVWEDDACADYDGGSIWLLRSPGNVADDVAYVYADGCVIPDGGRVDYARVGVRPALWLSATGDVAGAEGEGAASFPTVEFGTYPQGADGEVEPIEWYVLEERDGRKLLLSKYILDAQPYNKKYNDVTWETCTLRTWLNADFLEAAFSLEDQARIAEAELENPDNPDFGTPGGNPTRDRVFCLSLEEAMRYFSVGRTWTQLLNELGLKWYSFADSGLDYARIYADEPGYEALAALATEYAVSRGASVRENNAHADYDSASLWWLRSPGPDVASAAYVSINGFVDSDGPPVNWPEVGVRPALWLNS